GPPRAPQPLLRRQRLVIRAHVGLVGGRGQRADPVQAGQLGEERDLGLLGLALLFLCRRGRCARSSGRGPARPRGGGPGGTLRGRQRRGEGRRRRRGDRRSGEVRVVAKRRVPVAKNEDRRGGGAGREEQ